MSSAAARLTQSHGAGGERGGGDLGEEGELGALALGEGLDFGVRPRLLGPELVAGKTQHLQLVATDHSGQLNCAGHAECQPCA